MEAAIACRAAVWAGPVAEISTAVSTRNPTIPTPSAPPPPPIRAAVPAATTVPAVIGTVADALGKAAVWPATQAALWRLWCVGCGWTGRAVVSQVPLGCHTGHQHICRGEQCDAEQQEIKAGVSSLTGHFLQRASRRMCWDLFLHSAWYLCRPSGTTSRRFTGQGGGAISIVSLMALTHIFNLCQK